MWRNPYDTSSLMKILYIVPYAPNLIRVRPYQLICTLAENNHEITVATLWTTKEEREDLRVLERLGVSIIACELPILRSAWNCLCALFSRVPLQSSFCWQPRLAKKLQEHVQSTNYDVIHIEHLRGAKYGLVLNKAGLRVNERRLPPMVWDSVDCISHLFLQASQESSSLKSRMMTKLELARTERYEGWLCNQFDRVIVTSQTDADVLGKLRDKDALSSNIQGCSSDTAPFPKEISVVPNGVDLNYFEYGHEAREPMTIVFSGKMSYHANVTAALYLVNDVMPLVWSLHPKAKVQIVGKDPTSEILALATNDSAGFDQGIKQVEVTGTVPDIRPYLYKATIAAAPIPYGAGIQNKVLEAMACGAPVVASTQAASGLGLQQVGNALVIAKDARMFADSMIDLLEQPEKQQHLSQTGRRFVESHFSWDAAVQSLEMIYADLIPQ